MAYYALHSSDCYCVVGIRMDRDIFLNKYLLTKEIGSRGEMLCL